MDKQRRFESLKKCLAVCLLLVFIPLGIKAQNAKQVSQTANERTQILEGYTIRGVVNDADGNPLPGASVRFKEKDFIGTTTNANGQFKMEVPSGVTGFTISFIGMKTATFTLSKKKSEYIIVMKENSEILEDVVITGYGNVSKGNYTGAASTVKADNILLPNVSSLGEMLQGVVPGMLVMNGSGMTGSTPKIRVRGTSTLLGSQDPVWVVDGVIQQDPQPFDPEDNSKFASDADDIRQLAGNAISWLNPNDIESITVLKDASATAIYGSKAANGVIVITTKKADKGKIAVNYNGDFSVGMRPHYGMYDRMNSAEIMQLSKDIYDERRSYTKPILPIGYAGLVQKLINKEITLEEMNQEYQKMASRNTDWFGTLFRNSFNQSHNISISGGNDKFVNRTSFGYSGEKGEAKGNDVNLFTATSNTTVHFGSKLMVNLLLKGSVRDVKGFAYGVNPFDYAYSTSRVIPIYQEDGSLFYHEKIGEINPENGKEMYNYNILNEMRNTGSKNTARTFGATIDLRWKILPCLEYQGMVSYNTTSSDSKKYASEHSFFITQTRGYEFGTVLANSPEQKASRLPFGGLLETDLNNNTSAMVRNSLVYDRSFREKHRVTFQLGVETNSIQNKGGYNKRYGYLPDRGETFATPPLIYYERGEAVTNTAIANGAASVVNRKDNALSEYLSAVYNYNDLYILNVNGRVDASNRFGQNKNHRFEPTWSTGIKWRVANEPFIQKLNWLNNLDLYASFGYQGNAVTSVSPYLIAYDGGLDNRYNEYVLNIKSLPYPSLGWEKTKTYNIGLDGALFGGRFNFTVNYFKKISDVLSSRNIPYENGIANGVVSGSTMENHGYDFVIDVVPIRTKDFTWQLSVNTAVSRNKIEKNDRVNTLNDYLDGSAIVNGRPYSTFYSYKFAGLNPENGLPMFDNMDLEHGKSPMGYLIESGKFTPDFSGGLNTMFKYKNFAFYALFSIQWGGHARLPKLYSATDTESGLPRPEQNVSNKLNNRWKKPGDELHTDIPSLPGAGNEFINLPETATTQTTRTNLYHMYNLSDVRTARTDFVRCRSISMSYEFNNGQWMDKLFLKRLQVKASMSNPFVWAFDKKWDGLDPETGSWPARKVISISLQAAF